MDYLKEAPEPVWIGSVGQRWNSMSIHKGNKGNRIKTYELIRVFSLKKEECWRTNLFWKLVNKEKKIKYLSVFPIWTVTENIQVEDKGTFLLTAVSQEINEEGMTQLEHHHFSTPPWIHKPRKSSPRKEITRNYCDYWWKHTLPSFEQPNQTKPKTLNLNLIKPLYLGNRNTGMREHIKHHHQVQLAYFIFELRETLKRQQTQFLQ